MRFHRDECLQIEARGIDIQDCCNGCLNFALLGLRRQTKHKIGTPDIESQKFGRVQLCHLIRHVSCRLLFMRRSTDPFRLFDPQSNSGRMLDQDLSDVRRDIRNRQRRYRPGFVRFDRHDTLQRHLAGTVKGLAKRQRNLCDRFVVGVVIQFPCFQTGRFHICNFQSAGDRQCQTVDRLAEHLQRCQRVPGDFARGDVQTVTG